MSSPEDPCPTRATPRRRRRPAPRRVGASTPGLLLCLLLPGLSSCSLLAGPDESDGASYHSAAEIARDFRALADSRPDIAQVLTVGRSIENRDIIALRVGTPASGGAAGPAVLVVAGQHAREWLPIEVAVELARHLVTAYGTDAAVSALLGRGEIWIVPVANPDGHDYTRTTARFWRKNRRSNGDGSTGVDLNRNFDYAWSAESAAGQPGSEFYRGPAPFSEPEARALRDLIASGDFRAVVDLHAFGQSIAVPQDRTLMRSTGDEMAALISAVHGKTYRVDPYAPPLYPGSLTDWGSQVADLDAYLVEVRPGGNRDAAEFPWLADRDPFDPPESEIAPTWEELRPALLHLFQTYLGLPR